MNIRDEMAAALWGEGLDAKQNADKVANVVADRLTEIVGYSYEPEPGIQVTWSSTDAEVRKYVQALIDELRGTHE